MIELLFPDGSVVTGATYRETEDALRATSMTPYPTRRAFRRDMRRRATLWSGPGLNLRPCVTSKQFLHQLAKAGMCRIEHT